MADEIDRANDHLERWLQGRIEEYQHQLNQMVDTEQGRCRNCQEKLDDGRAYCDEYCRDDFQYRLAANRRNVKYI